MTVMAPAAPAAFLYLPPDETSGNAAHGAGAGSDIGSTAAGQPERRTIVREVRENGDAVSVERAETTTPGSRRFETAPPLRRTVTTADARQAEPASGAAETEAHTTGLWSIRANETLRGVMDRWGGRAGVEVVFLTDRHYRLHEARAFEGSFADATQALLAALSQMPHAPVGEMRPDERTLAVLHRTRSSGDGR